MGRFASKRIRSVQIVAAAVLVLASAACGEDYWEPPEAFEGESVASLSGQPSKEAHDAFAECGLGDEDIEKAVTDYRQSGTGGESVSQSFDAEGNLLAATSVSEVGTGIFRVTCSTEGFDAPEPAPS